jgi:predicted 3-demethylubiquinone-9 3-methyltransferase (glyoxalase superfamily)
MLSSVFTGSDMIRPADAVLLCGVGPIRRQATPRCPFHGKETLDMQKITPFLWFNDNIEEALTLYTSVFKNSQIVSMNRGGGDNESTVTSATFHLEGQPFLAFNGGPHFTFNPAISLFVDCQTQAEVDELWEKLSEGGEKSRCGWLTDKFGLSWQIIPSVLGELMNDEEDDEKAGRVRDAMLGMTKIDIAGLKRAHAGE